MMKFLKSSNRLRLNLSTIYCRLSSIKSRNIRQSKSKRSRLFQQQQLPPQQQSPLQQQIKSSDSTIKIMGFYEMQVKLKQSVISEKVRCRLHEWPRHYAGSRADVRQQHWEVRHFERRYRNQIIQSKHNRITSRWQQDDGDNYVGAKQFRTMVSIKTTWRTIPNQKESARRRNLSSFRSKKTRLYIEAHVSHWQELEKARQSSARAGEWRAG